MQEKKQVYDLDVMALPPLRLVLGDVPVPDPDKQQPVYHDQLKNHREMEGTIKRLIAHLKEYGE
jgi:hypothetical protein